MVSFMFSVVAGYAMAPARSKAGGGNAQLTASSALTIIRICGCISAVLAFYAPLYTFVKPVLEERSVRDRMVYANLIAFFNSVMWTLYASTDLPSRLLFFIISGAGIVFQCIYIYVYILFAEGKKRAHALILLLAVVVITLVMTTFVAAMVLTHRWSSTVIDVMASASGASMHIFPVFDVVMVLRSKQINNMKPITPLISLVGSSIWTAYGFMSIPVNLYVLVPNLLGIVSATMQIVVYLIYRKTIVSGLEVDAVDHNSVLKEHPAEYVV